MTLISTLTLTFRFLLLDRYARLKEFVEEWGEHGPLYKALLDWIDRFGYYCDWQGGEYYISVGSLNTFTNHACNGSETIEGPFDHNLSMENLWEGDDTDSSNFLDLVSTRHPRTICVEQRAKHAMPANTEILDSFINYYDPEVQPEKIGMVNAWCGITPGNHNNLERNDDGDDDDETYNYSDEDEDGGENKLMWAKGLDGMVSDPSGGSASPGAPAQQRHRIRR